MDPILSMLLSWQFVLFGLAVAAIVFVLRTIVEYIFTIEKDVPKIVSISNFWNNLLLPILPIVLGCVGGIYLKTFPYPDGLSTAGSRGVFGLVAGLFSTVMYRVIKSLLVQKITAVAQNLPGTAITATEQVPANQVPPRGQA